MLSTSSTTWNAPKTRSPLWENRLLSFTIGPNAPTSPEERIEFNPTQRTEIDTIKNNLINELNTIVHNLQTAAALPADITQQIQDEFDNANLEFQVYIATQPIVDKDLITADEINKFLQGKNSIIDPGSSVDVGFNTATDATNFGYVPTSKSINPNHVLSAEAQEQVNGLRDQFRTAYANVLNSALENKDVSQSDFTTIATVTSSTKASLATILGEEDQREKLKVNLKGYDITDKTKAEIDAFTLQTPTITPITDPVKPVAPEKVLDAESLNSKQAALRELESKLDESVRTILVFEQLSAKLGKIELTDEKKEIIPFETLMNVKKEATAMRNIVRLQLDWLQGYISPQEFINKYTLAIANIKSEHLEFHELPGVFNDLVLKEMRNRHAQFGVTDASKKHTVELSNWARANMSDKLTLSFATSSLFDTVKDETINVMDVCKLATASIEEINKKALYEYKTKNPAASNETEQTMFQSIVTLGGSIKWMTVSPLEIIKAIKDVKAALEAAFNSKTDQKAAVIASLIGDGFKLLPNKVLNNVGTELNKASNERSTKASDSIKGLYDFNSEDFNTVQLNLKAAIASNDSASKIGIIKYAASRGWLYRIEEISSDPNSLLLGAKISEIFDTTSASDLDKILNVFRSQNIKGAQTEREAAYDRVIRQNDADFYVRELNKELDAKNLPAVMGIMKAAVKTGKRSTISLEMVTNILRKVQDVPELRDLISQEWVTSAGQDGEQFKFAFGVGLFKQDDKAFFEWLALDKLEDNMDKGNLMVQVVGAVEKRILKLDPGLKDKKQKLDKMIANVIAGAAVNVTEVTTGKLKKVAIWEKEFDFFRKSRPIQEYDPPDPFAEDFGYITGPSGQILRGPSSVTKVLKFETDGTLRKSDFVTGFIAKVHNRKNEMEAALGREEIDQYTYDTFLLEIQTRFNDWFIANMPSRTSQYAAMLEVKDASDPTKKMFANMVENNIISREVIAQLLVEAGTDTSKSVLIRTLNKQLKNEISDEELEKARQKITALKTQRATE